MSEHQSLKHKFVEFIPEELEDATVYISIRFATASHLCLCGCKNKVVTPLSPTDWKLTFDGKSISLYPSIGNWSFACRSHYWIRKNCMFWAEDWSEERIAAGRARDDWSKEQYYSSVGESREPQEANVAISETDSSPKKPWWKRWWPYGLRSQ